MTQNKPPLGSIAWIDLTVENAAQIRDFYSQVVGWEADALSLGDYDDFNMQPAGSDEAVSGICHARGPNANLPAQWLIYITVADVARSAEQCVALGGTIIDGPRTMGDQMFCLIQDPAGAVAALISG
ncbi:MAG: VOC family protein [Anaerolineae bacterium]|nr:VOC family protein [Anaerolineae bacterium]